MIFHSKKFKLPIVKLYLAHYNKYHVWCKSVEIQALTTTKDISCQIWNDASYCLYYIKAVIRSRYSISWNLKLLSTNSCNFWNLLVSGKIEVTSVFSPKQCWISLLFYRLQSLCFSGINFVQEISVDVRELQAQS